MEDIHVRQYLVLQDGVLDGFRKRKFVTPACKDWSSGIQFLIIRSFGPTECWDFLEDGKPVGEGSVLLVRGIWRRDIDADKFRNPVEWLRHGFHVEPTLEHERFIIPTSTYQQLRDAIRDLPVLTNEPVRTIGLDGTSYELAWSDCRSSAGIIQRYAWWERVPAEWAPLAQCVVRILGVIHKMARQEFDK